MRRGPPSPLFYVSKRIHEGALLGPSHIGCRLRTREGGCRIRGLSGKAQRSLPSLVRTAGATVLFLNDRRAKLDGTDLSASSSARRRKLSRWTFVELKAKRVDPSSRVAVVWRTPFELPPSTPISPSLHLSQPFPPSPHSSAKTTGCSQPQHETPSFQAFASTPTALPPLARPTDDHLSRLPLDPRGLPSPCACAFAWQIG